MSSFYVFVEGDDDERFFRRILCSRLEKHYDRVQIVKYAQMEKRKIRKFIHTLERKSTEYVLVRDLDRYPCVTALRNQIAGRYGIGDEQRIVVVIPEIEAWYVAGIEREILRQIAGVRRLAIPPRVTKQWFNIIIPQSIPRSVFMNRIIERFDPSLAQRRSESFRYFVRKFL